MWSVLGLSRVKSDNAVARKRGLEWIKSIEPGTTIDARALRLLIEQEFGQPESMQTLLKQLLDTQHADGGWGWQPDDPSGAWATGLAMYALSEVKTDQRLESHMIRARDFLLKTQQEDGSWFVEGKLTKNAKMSSYFGTVWAVVGLSRTLLVKRD